ncbi:MAG: TonB-dependent receptor [Agarilytica sp.]
MLTRNRILSCQIGVACLFLPFSIASQATTDELEAENLGYLYSLPMEELIKIEVSVASVRPEPLEKTPALVSSYSSDDLAKMGLRTLQDMLSFVPGLVIDNSSLGNTNVWMRGVMEEFGQKVLFLIDDVPYWMPSHSAIPLLGIPFEAIDRIEVIRGPGAVIYGSNATAGVIKVVTRKDENSNLKLSRGYNQRWNAGGYISHEISKGHTLSLAAEVQDEAGYTTNINASRSSAQIPLKLQEEMQSMLLSYRNARGAVMLHAFESTNIGRSGIGASEKNELKYTGSLIHADYSWAIGKSNVKAYSHYNEFYLTFLAEDRFGARQDAEISFNPTSKNYRATSGLLADLIINEQLKFDAGLEHERVSIGDYRSVNSATGEVDAVIIESDSNAEASVFAQLHMRVGSFNFVFGGRHVDNQRAGSDFTPRGSIVYSLNSEQTLKLLYSEGFNSANFVQTSIELNTPGGTIEGNMNLKPEKVKTTELAFTHNEERLLTVFNLFYLEAEDFITRVNQGADRTFENSENYRRFGAEFDLQKSFYRMNLFVNAAHIHQGNTEDNEDPRALFTPQWTASLGSTYFLNGKTKHTIGASHRYVSQRADIDSYNLINLNYTFRLPQIEFSMTYTDALGDNTKNPDTARNALEYVPRSDSGATATLKYFF